MNPSKIQSVVYEIDRERGPIDFAALLLRDDSPGRWDLVLSGPGVIESDRAMLEFVSEKLRKTLTPEEMIEISRISLLRMDAADRKTSQVMWLVGRSLGYRHNAGLFRGVPVAEAYYLISDPPPESTASSDPPSPTSDAAIEPAR